jgi:hypothetical protein
VTPSIEPLQHLPELPLVRADVQLRSARGRGVSRAGVVRPYLSYRPGWTSFSRLGGPGQPDVARSVVTLPGPASGNALFDLNLG